MSLQLTWLTVPLLLAGGLHVALVGLVWRERPKAGATWFALDLLSIALWSLGQAVVVSATALDVAIAGFNLTVVGLGLIVPTWLLFALRYTGHADRLSGWTASWLFVEPVALIALGLTNGAHELLYVDPGMSPAAGAEAFSFAVGPALWAHYGYALVLLLVGDWYMYRKFVGSRNVFRNRTFLILAASVLMTVAYTASMFGLSPLPHVTLAPLLNLSTVVVGLAAVLGYVSFSQLPLGRVLGVFSSRARSLTPLARNTAIEGMDSGFLVTDHSNRIVDVNAIAKRMIGVADDRVVGKPLTEVLPSALFVDEDPAFLEPTATGEYTGVWVETDDGERRCFDLHVTALGGDDEFVGRVGLITDVTERERRKERLEHRNSELERQNEQLEDFASIVSHDLRNPLNVATGRLELSDADDEHVAVATDALDRMEELIDDVLTLARQGQTVSETAPVDLAAAAREAWRNVETGDAALTVAGEATVRADRARLLQLLENLFRNAIEHGGEAVDVRIGTTDGGFFLADDGPGIPPADREDVFERGFSTADSGTGFGLSIVRTIADAHGWDIAVTESADDGARFEVDGVQGQAAAEAA